MSNLGKPFPVGMSEFSFVRLPIISQLDLDSQPVVRWSLRVLKQTIGLLNKQGNLRE